MWPLKNGIRNESLWYGQCKMWAENWKDATILVLIVNIVALFCVKTDLNIILANNLISKIMLNFHVLIFFGLFKHLLVWNITGLKNRFFFC